ncbi:A/G-specific adenine glycosylase [Acholeplasma laidlawii]|uniref:A/G-specific adenine glycosylase n=1 Tax=Acholeplasma laidlawii TaxID=2148 RepID=UPI003F917031
MAYLRLFEWYQANKRDLPFRKTDNPYHIWVSEIMLQQTQVDTMLPFYDRFLTIFPTIHDLADAAIDDVLKVVQGIGYYKRFRMLHKGAQYVIDHHDGKLPEDYFKILKIPGIGAYTAGAIMSIAFHKPYPATDGNVIRVLSRVKMLEDDFRLDKHKKKLNELNKELIENSNNPYLYTQSMMELGATVCKVSNPLCDNCPLQDLCLANINNVQQNYPKMSPLRTKKEIQYFTFILEYKEEFLMRKRTEDLLHGFYEFVQIESDSLNGALIQAQELGLEIQLLDELQPIKHIFTHMIWQINLYRGTVNSTVSPYEIVHDFSKVPIATVVKKQIKQI